MREHVTTALVSISDTANLTDIVFDRGQREPTSVCLRRASGEGWVDVTCAAFRDEVSALAKGLIAAGIGPGDRVALMSRTRFEWTLADYAIWAAGAVSVPIYDTSSADQVGWIVEDSEAVAAIVETVEQAAVLARAKPDLPALREVWTIDEGALDRLVAGGAQVSDSEVEARRRSRGAGSTATVLYTSGTTGRPKGCELTHRNFLFGATTFVGALPELFTPGSSTLLFLPLAHVFAREIEVGVMLAETTMGHCNDAKNITADLMTFRPTFILAVPYAFERIYRTAEQKAANEGRTKLFAMATDTAVAYSMATASGARPGLGLRLRHAVFDKLVYRRIRAGLGGRVQYAISGGAPLAVRLGHFFRGCGITVLEGYGLTETTAGAALNLPSAFKLGSVGRPLGDMLLRVSDDGELLVKGDHVFHGYWKNAAATAAAFDADGWFRTGDLGSIDDDGFVTITGRRKEIIVTAGGKNVAPAQLEDRIRAHPLVGQCMVVGDHRNYVACLITLDPQAFAAWKARQGKPTEATVTELREDPNLIAELQGAIDEANASVSRAEAIKRFRILDSQFTQEGGQLTPTLKLKRSVILSQYADDVERLYAR